MLNTSAVLVLSVCFALTSAPLFAHHSFEAEFDGSKLLVLTGTLTKLEWQNPHGFFYVGVKDDNGKVTNWAIEIASPSVLRRADEQMREHFLQNIGKTLSFTASPAKNGTPRAAAEDVKFVDGRISAMGSKRYFGDQDSVKLLQSLK